MRAIDAILFDLDDTLLGNDMDVFLQSYFPLLAAYARPMIGPERFLPELVYATQAVIGDDDPSQTNRDVFWRVFCGRNELDREEVEPFLATFYEEHFSQLRSKTQRRPEAEPLVRWCFDQGLKVVIATNPLFPQNAVEQRMAWAGIPADQFDFDLVTVYENMHAAKPNAAYYREILTAVNVEPDRALMVGDDWENDIVPAGKMGLYTFWISAPHQELPSSEVAPGGSGELKNLFEKLQAGWLTQ